MKASMHVNMVSAPSVVNKFKLLRRSKRLVTKFINIMTFEKIFIFCSSMQYKVYRIDLDVSEK